MNQIEIGGFRRISRTKARNLYNAGNMVYLCASNVSPVSIWQPAAGIRKPVGDDSADTTFESRVDAFAFYNCSKETGNCAFFYEKTA